MICPGDNFLLSQLKIAKTFIVTKAEICCTWSGNWSEAAGDYTTTAYDKKTGKYSSLFFSSQSALALRLAPPTHVDKVTGAFLSSHGVFDAGPEGLRGAGVIFLLIVSPHFTCHHASLHLTFLASLHISPASVWLQHQVGGWLSSPLAPEPRREEDGDTRPGRGEVGTLVTSPGQLDITRGVHARKKCVY